MNALSTKLGPSGSYLSEDVTFAPIISSLSPVPVAEQTAAFERGEGVVFDKITPEPVPDDELLRLFDAALARNAARLAKDVLRLAAIVAEERTGPRTVLSVIRAGVPFGVLLARTLRRAGIPARHFAVSMIREKGLDRPAMLRILDGIDPDSILWVDGWTGKGATADALRRHAERFGRDEGVKLPLGLRTLQDLAGAAETSASDEDRLIPSAMLNAPASGLSSRSVANADGDETHRIAFFPELLGIDRSRRFVELIDAAAIEIDPSTKLTGLPRRTQLSREERRRRMTEIVLDVSERFDAEDLDRIKPGINEASRALALGRAESLLLRNPEDPDVAHLLLEAQRRAVAVIENRKMPLSAIAVSPRLKAVDASHRKEKGKRA
jgi:hypothetical protein